MERAPSITSLNFAANGANIHNGDRHFRIGFANGGFVALSAEPEQPQALNPVRNGIEIIMKLQKKIADIQNDPRLTDMAKNEKIRPLREAAAKDTTHIADQVAVYDTAVTSKETAMFAVPAIERTDAVTYLEDDSIRKYYFGLKGKELRTALEKIQNGENSRALLALLRSPTPLPGVFNEIAFDAWKKSIRNEKRREVTMLRDEREAVDWAQSGMEQLQRLVTK